jgi:hypothetical protein
MSFSKCIFSLILTVFLVSCGEGTIDLGGEMGRQPIFGFSELLKGKEVKMVNVIDEELSLVVSDTSRISVQFTSTPTDERLKINDWTFDYEKAIKYKKYYFLHRLVDSSFYEVLVVGRYFTKYYGFEDAFNQNYNIYKGLVDTIDTSTLHSFRVDSLSLIDFVINPSSKKVVKEFYKNLLKSSYLRNEGLDNFTKEIVSDVLQKLDVKKLEISENIKIYPNPVEGIEMNVTSDLITVEDAQLSIVNSLGQEVKCLQSSNGESVKVNVLDLKSGSYFAVITSEGRRSSGKFVVVK